MISDLLNTLAEHYQATLLEDLEVDNTGRDVDLYIPPEQQVAAFEYLVQAGWTLQPAGEDKMRAFQFVGGLFYQLDIVKDFNYLTVLFPYLTLNPSFTQRVLSDLDFLDYMQAVLFLRHEPRHLERIEDYHERYRSCLRDGTVMRPYFLKRMLSVADMQNFVKKRWRSLVRGVGWRATFGVYIQILRGVLARFNTGQIVVFVGPDGSGKTTVIERLKMLPNTKEMYMGDRGFRFQAFYDIFHRQHIYISRLAYPFYYVENLLRYIRAYSLKLRGYIVLVDRYPGMNRHTGRSNNVWYHPQNLMYACFPRATTYIFISAPPEIVHQRKQEMTLAEITASQAFLRDRISRRRRHCEIENIDLIRCLNTALAFILKKSV